MDLKNDIHRSLCGFTAHSFKIMPYVLISKPIWSILGSPVCFVHADFEGVMYEIRIISPN
jgi:hypothetical protein